MSNKQYITHRLSIMNRYYTVGIIALIISIAGWIIPSHTLYAATPCNADNTICIDSQLAPFWQKQGGVTDFWTTSRDEPITHSRWRNHYYPTIRTR
jgi:hypothetical protein